MWTYVPTPAGSSGITLSSKAKWCVCLKAHLTSFTYTLFTPLLVAFMHLTVLDIRFFLGGGGAVEGAAGTHKSDCVCVSESLVMTFLNGWTAAYLF